MTGMMTSDNPFADLGLDRAIQLRWSLRDIRAHRLALSPISDDDLSLLKERGLVELKDGIPKLTPAGDTVVD